MTFIPKAPDDWFNEEIRLGKGIFNRKSCIASIEPVKNFDLAVDIGAHVGTWSLFLATKFKTVIAYEPDPINYKFLMENISNSGLKNIFAYQTAVGCYSGYVYIDSGPRNSGQKHIVEYETDNFAVIDCIDDSNLEPDYIKIDVEGYELNVLKGAERTIKQSKPVICLEKNGLAESRYNLLEKEIDSFLSDYTLYRKVKYDYIYTPK